MKTISRLVPAALAAALLLPVAPRAAAWSGQQHVQISYAAGKNAPNEMRAFRYFSRPMAYPSIYPDLWKMSDYDEEGIRHYFEPDRLRRGFDLSAIPDDVSKLQAVAHIRPEEIGTAPWVVRDLVRDMSDAMRAGDWLLAARLGAGLSHYAGDLHMPLHCTKNFNGQESGQSGVHSRIEADLIKSFFKSSMLDRKPAQLGQATYIDDPFRAAIQWASDSYQMSVKWLRADREAFRAANRHNDTEDYYRTLWDLIGDSVILRISQAATDLSSLYYTAWVDAGKPDIPEPFEELPSVSIWNPAIDIEPAENDPGRSSIPAQSARTKGTYDLLILGFFAGIACLVLFTVILKTFMPNWQKRRE